MDCRAALKILKNRELQTCFHHGIIVVALEEISPRPPELSQIDIALQGYHNVLRSRDLANEGLEPRGILKTVFFKKIRRSFCFCTVKPDGKVLYLKKSNLVNSKH